MNKIIFSFMSIGAIFASTAVLAGDFSQYVTGRAAYVDLHNKARNTMAVGSATYSIVDGTMADNIGGFRIAYGVQKDFPQIHGDIRAEMEYGYNMTAKEHGRSALMQWQQKTNSQTILLNAYYDIHTDTKVTPYIGGGLGMAHLKTSEFGRSDLFFVGRKKDNNEFAWNLQAGLSYHITENWKADLGYRYSHLGYSKMRLTDGAVRSFARYKISTHEVGLGLRYQF